jgi:hypothetical protein
MSDEKERFPKGRTSASADSAFRAEMRRVKKMTVEERVATALSLGKRLAKATSPNKGQ